MAGRTGPSGDVRAERKVEVGQVWADLDKRSHKRRLLVRELKGAAPMVICEVIRRTDGKAPKATPRMVAIRADRFRPGSTGYKLVAVSCQQWEALGSP